MIDPRNIVNYEYCQRGLEELAVFCVCVAGKKASTIAPRVHKLVQPSTALITTDLGNVRSIVGLDTPFKVIKAHKKEYLESRMRFLGIGCYRQKAETLLQLATSDIDLRTCSVSDLEAIKGIGPKTSRFFIMSSRRDVQYAALDTHILRWMRDQGVPNVPKSTPTGKKYLDLERTFIKMVPEGMSPAEFDLEIWRKYSA